MGRAEWKGEDIFRSVFGVFFVVLFVMMFLVVFWGVSCGFFSICIFFVFLLFFATVGDTLCE